MGIQELIVILALFVIATVSVLVIVFIVRRVAGSGTRAADGPSDQQPPPGYWWDGQKWNPPDTT
jgi:hypothetical protein